MRRYLIAAMSIVLAGCGDASAPRAVPTAIEITTPPSGTATAGVVLPTSPAFVVKDQNGNAMAGVPVTVTVSAGGGSIANAPSTTSSQPTSAGTWTLGRSIGLNSLTISVQGPQPVVVSVNSAPGAPARIAATTPTLLTGTVGQLVNVSLSASLLDAFDNAIPNFPLGISITGGGTAPQTVTTDAAGNATVTGWTLGTIKGTNTLTLLVGMGTAPVTFSVSAAAGPLEALEIVSGDNQAALAGTILPQAARFAARDQYGNRLDNQVAFFAVQAGGGTLAGGSAASSPDGSIAMPSFTLGKSAVPQSVVATLGAKTAILHATVVTSYVMDVRFWGPTMTADQQALFTNAAARIRGILVGSVPTVDGTGADPAACGVSGVPVLTENIPGVIIYASVQAIDGPGQILASAGPCYVRDQNDFRTVVGVMRFDEADLASLTNGGSLQDVITHEMLHVVGVGAFWNAKGLLTGYNTSAVAYIGSEGIIGCRVTGGTTSCASAVPVENTGGSGTANSHWRESVFGSELMTGYANAGPMPFSIMTARSLTDIGYTINPAAVDAYFIFAGSLRANSNLIPGTSLSRAWERGLDTPPRPLPSRASAARKERVK